MTAAGAHHLGLLCEEVLDRHGDHPALLFGGAWLGAGELHRRSCAVAGGLRELGVEPGDRVAVVARNRPEVAIAYRAAWRAGAVVTPAIFLLSEADLGHVLRDSGAKVVIAEGGLVERATAAGSGAAVVSLGPAGCDAVPWAQLEAAVPAPLAARADDDLAALLYTGGTTGRSKAVMLSHANLWFAGKSRSEAGYAPGVTRTLVTLPMSHSFGVLVTVANLHWPEPRQVALLPWFDAEEFLATAERERVHDATVVPAMLQALLELPLEARDLGALRYLVCGSAPLPADVGRAFRERLPAVELREGYGLTEASAYVAASPAGAVRAGSVGRPVPRCEVRIVGDGGAALGPGEDGEITVRSPFVMRGYWNEPELTAEAVRDGWLHTGDVGHLDGDGYLFVVDRKKDLIIRGGFNVYPRDVEDALLEHPGVRAAAVIGRPDPARGEEVVAFVVTGEDGPAPEEIVAFGRERLGGYKYPREVHRVEALPRTALGKVDRKALRARLAPQSHDARSARDQWPRTPAG
jgi:long-chain acyl-CoA synthetase